MDIVDLTLVEVARAIRNKELSSREVTQACLERIERVQPKLNCFIAVEAEAALKAARAADRALAAGASVGPLHGVPLAHKDMFYRKGLVCTCGSKILRDFRPAITATVVERLYRAGAIWLGTLNMSEFAADATGHNVHFGDCRNAWNPRHVPGGSSSGSGAAVAARACFGALGSDTGGSIRHPAAANGVAGIKPTYGRVSRYGALPRSSSHDAVGVLARTARDCARLLRVIAGADPNDPSASASRVPSYERALSGSVKGLRVGVPVNYFYDGATGDVRACMDQSLAVLRSLGARIIELEVPDPQRLFDVSYTISQAEAAAFHARWMRERPQDYSLSVRTRTQAGCAIAAVDYLEAVELRPRLVQAFIGEVFAKVDVLHAPVMVGPVPTLDETRPDRPQDVRAIVNRISHNNRPANFLGIPALSVPAGFTANGLPAAFQLMGRPFAEAQLLCAGDAYQRATRWHEERPAL
ncbi:MAG: amidase [Burkholderiales bacterium]|nr:amidase [Burkholderiales bacterium]